MTATAASTSGAGAPLATAVPSEPNAIDAVRIPMSNFEAKERV